MSLWPLFSADEAPESSPVRSRVHPDRESRRSERTATRPRSPTWATRVHPRNAAGFSRATPATRREGRSQQLLRIHSPRGELLGRGKKSELSGERSRTLRRARPRDRPPRAALLGDELKQHRTIPEHFAEEHRGICARGDPLRFRDSDLQIGTRKIAAPAPEHFAAFLDVQARELVRGPQR